MVYNTLYITKKEQIMQSKKEPLQTVRMDLEPINPRYLRVNPETNLIHILPPVVGGTRIGTDNTCKSVYALASF